LIARVADALAPVSYLRKLVAGGAPVVGPSADWVNTAVRVSGNVDAGRVVFEDDAGGLELIEYTHNEDGERSDVLVARLDAVTGETIAA
jgi:hypothetical protein